MSITTPFVSKAARNPAWFTAPTLKLYLAPSCRDNPVQVQLVRELSLRFFQEFLTAVSESKSIFTCIYTGTITCRIVLLYKCCFKNIRNICIHLYPPQMVFDTSKDAQIDKQTKNVAQLTFCKGLKLSNNLVE